MSANAVPLHPEQAVGKATIARLAGDVSIATLQRAHLELAEQLRPWSASSLIALLAGATPADRELLLLQLEARR